MVGILIEGDFVAGGRAQSGLVQAGAIDLVSFEGVGGRQTDNYAIQSNKKYFAGHSGQTPFESFLNIRASCF